MSYIKPVYALVLLASLGCRRVEPIPSPGDSTQRNSPATFDGSKPGDEREVAGVKLCWCPPGRFLMGSPPDETERGRARTRSR